MTSVEDSKRRLILHGMFLFLLSLLTGFAEQQFSNPRIGLAAHLEGVMNGIFLIALGAIWALTGARCIRKLDDDHAGGDFWRGQRFAD